MGGREQDKEADEPDLSLSPSSQAMHDDVVFPFPLTPTPTPHHKRLGSQMASTLLAKTALRQALVVGARGPAVAAAARGAGVGSIGGSRRGLSWVKDVTVNVTFINHEVRRERVWGGE